MIDRDVNPAGGIDCEAPAAEQRGVGRGTDVAALSARPRAKWQPIRTQQEVQVGLHTQLKHSIQKLITG